MRDTSEQRRRKQEREEAQEQTPEAPAPTDAVLALQRGHGNAAVARAMLLRQPPATASAATLADLDAALDHFNVDEDDVISILGRLGPGDKARVVSGGYVTPLADCLNTREMARAVRALGVLPLGAALEWVEAAAGGWRSVDYEEIAVLVRNAPQSERDALKTTPWRDRFVDICTNATMLSAVLDLHFDLNTKLRWMLEEGTNAELLARAIRESATHDLAGVTSDGALMRALQDEVSASNWTMLEKMLRHGLLGEHAISETTAEGNTFSQWMALYRSGLYVTKAVKFVEKGTFAPGAFDAFRTRFINAVTTWVDNKYKIRITSPGAPQPGDGDYPIRVSLRDDSGAGYDLHMHGGAHGRGAVGDSEGDMYELGQPNEAAVPDVYLAHEGSHLMLGANDEYAEAGNASRVVYTDHSLMGDFYGEGTAAAELKIRHFSHLATQVAAMFPGRSVTIVR